MEHLKSVKLLNELGYSKEEIRKIVNSYPINSLKDDTLERKIKNNYIHMTKLGYSRPEVIKMTKVLPSLFSLSEENIKLKVKYLRNINLDFIVTEDTKKLMQSLSLTYARYEYFKNERMKIINEETYRRLFYGSKVFKKMYGISNEELIKKYDYELFKNICIK